MKDQGPSVNKASASEYRIFWMRRDLRLKDNRGLAESLRRGPVQPLFIFDPDILDALQNPDDARVTFIWHKLTELKAELRARGADLWVLHGRPDEVFPRLFAEEAFTGIDCNGDYEPSACARDARIEKWALSRGLEFRSFKDQVIFEKSEVVTDAGTPYSVFTPYKKKWLSNLRSSDLRECSVSLERLIPRATERRMPTLEDIGFRENSKIVFPSARWSRKSLRDYATLRDLPARDATSRLGLHLRFGTISPRRCVAEAQEGSEVWLSELIWREFFMQILFHYPRVVDQSFRPEYDRIEWRKSQADFERWQEGVTGYPLVDAGMRELRETGFMHNRVRMVTASFLTKHLLHHWLDGERYFARELLDYDLAANNGNWQWAAGSGCDAAPYFRVFNPEIQLKKFDPQLEYVKRWVPEFQTSRYPEPMIEHAAGRDRALRAYSAVLQKNKKG